MKDALNAFVGILSVLVVCALVVMGPVALLLAGLLLPILMPLVLAALMAGGITAALVSAVRWFLRP